MDSTVIFKGWRRWLAVALVVLCTVGVQGCILDQIDAAIEQLRAFNHTFEDIDRILRNLQMNLDAGVYRDQVNDIVGRAGQVATLGVIETVDFVRQRAVEDLQRIKAEIKHQPLPPRVPYLASVQVPYIDVAAPGRTTMSVVGWNLDVAHDDQENKYSVEIMNQNGTRRRIADDYIAYAGQYQVNVNVSQSGVPFQVGDQKLVFRGFTPAFEVPIINSDAIPAKGLRFESNQDRDEKDSDIKVHVRLTIGGVVYFDQQFGKGFKWPDNTLIRNEFVAAAADHKICVAEAYQKWGLDLWQHRGEFDESCLHLVIDDKLARLPGLTGRKDATLTVETLEDSSGWGTTLVLLARTDRILVSTGVNIPQEEIHEVFRTESYMFNRDGNGASKTWTFKW